MSRLCKSPLCTYPLCPGPASLWHDYTECGIIHHARGETHLGTLRRCGQCLVDTLILKRGFT